MVLMSEIKAPGIRKTAVVGYKSWCTSYRKKLVKPQLCGETEQDEKCKKLWYRLVAR